MLQRDTCYSIWQNATPCMPLHFHLMASNLRSAVFPMWKKEAETDQGGVDVWELQTHRGIQTLRAWLAVMPVVYYSLMIVSLQPCPHDWQLGVWDAKSGQLRCILENAQGIHRDILDWPSTSMQSISLLHRTHCPPLRYQYRTNLCGNGLFPWVNDRLAFHPSGKLLLFRNEKLSKIFILFQAIRIQHLSHSRFVGQEPTKPIAEIGISPQYQAVQHLLRWQLLYCKWVNSRKGWY